MRDRKKRNIIIGALCCLLVFMGIGYAILSQTLNISGIANMRGNWNVRITNMELLGENKTGRAEEVSHSFTDTTATFTADLYMPGDSIEYRVTVENQGNIDAVLQSITPTTTNKVADIKFSHSEIDNTPLTAGKTITFTMKVEFLESATAIPDVERTEYKLELVYMQYDGVSQYTQVNEANDTSCFNIDDEGTILSYNSDLCGTNIVVPAKINNIPVKNVNRYTLTDANATKTSDGKYVMDKQEDYDALQDQYKQSYRETMTNSINASIDEQAKESGKTREEVESEMLDLLKEELPTITTIDEYINYVVENNVDDSWKNGERIYVRGTSEAPIVNNRMSCTYDEDETISWSSGGQCIPIIYFDEDGNYEGELSHSCSTSGERTSRFSVKGSGDLLANSISYEASKKYAKKLGRSSLLIFLDDDGDGAATIANPNYGNVDSCTGPNRVKITLSNENVVDIAKVTLNMTSLDLSQAIYMEEIEPYSFYGLGYDSDGVLQESKAFSLRLPENLKSIGKEAFMGANVAGTLLIPKNVERIDDSAFQQGLITTLEFESGGKLKTIGGAAFAENKISSLILSNNIETVEDYAFSLNKLSSVTLPNSLKNIYEYAFAGNQLTTITIPKSVTTIGMDAFRENKLTSLNFEEGTTIRYLDGFNDNQLTSITIPKSVTEISHTAFTNNKITNIIYENGINLKYLSGFEGNQLTSLTMPNTVKTVGYNAFASNQLTNDGLAKLPSGITRMLKDAFKNNPSLTQITLTSPTDIDNWPNGGTVNGATVTYER